MKFFNIVQSLISVCEQVSEKLVKLNIELLQKTNYILNDTYLDSFYINYLN